MSDLNPKKITRAACEECRTRKLKCSGNRNGNRNGCDRCIRDRVPCVYSEQKKMGRPRKPRPNRSFPESKSSPITDARNVYPPHQQPFIFNNLQSYLNDDLLPNEGCDWFPVGDLDMRMAPNDNAHGMFDFDFAFANDSHSSTQGDSPGSSCTSPPSYGGLGIPPLMAALPPAALPNYLIDARNPVHQHPHQHGTMARSTVLPESHDFTFNTPSPQFTSQSPILPPAPPTSTATNSPHLDPVLFTSSSNLNLDPHGSSPPPPPSDCDCIFNFYMAISQLKIHLTKTPIPFQSAISTSRSALSTASISLSCPSCQCHFSSLSHNESSSQGNTAYISNMFLGALLPMLCTFYSKALESIDLMAGNQRVQIEGHEVDIELETWKEMARGAMKKEARMVDTLVEEMERISLTKDVIVGGALREAAGVLWNPLCSKIVSSVKFNKGPIKSFDYDNMIRV